ncbi:hypothetical protein D1007_28796 [Hordeum vulgare]|nr:hypothetical protein D1007_28796 [Hordeum vulgare]
MPVLRRSPKFKLIRDVTLNFTPYKRVLVWMSLIELESVDPFGWIIFDFILAPKTKNLVVGGGLTGFDFAVYYYTMRAVGNTDELQVAIDKFEDLKKRDDAATPAANPSTPGSS